MAPEVSGHSSDCPRCMPCACTGPSVWTLSALTLHSMSCNADEYSHGPPETTVIELAGPDRAGKLAEVTRLLVNNGCDVRSAAVRNSTLNQPCLPLLL